MKPWSAVITTRRTPAFASLATTRGSVACVPEHQEFAHVFLAGRQPFLRSSRHTIRRSVMRPGTPIEKGLDRSRHAARPESVRRPPKM